MRRWLAVPILVGGLQGPVWAQEPDLAHTSALDPAEVAAYSSLALTGAGQFMNGEWLKGSLLLSTNLLYPAGYAADYWTRMDLFRWMAIALMLGFKAYAVWDAGTVASKLHAQPQVEK